MNLVWSCSTRPPSAGSLALMTLKSLHYDCRRGACNGPDPYYFNSVGWCKYAVVNYAPSVARC